MTVSVVIPSYNEDRVIAKCISSLVTQTKKCEIIVVDDGSTDKTQSILSEIQIPNFKFQIL
ncbi:MAG: glycosyltransferase, partial [Patescibacteria group bacterium]